MDNKTNELRNNEIETVTGGITQEQLISCLPEPESGLLRVGTPGRRQ